MKKSKKPTPKRSEVVANELDQAIEMREIAVKALRSSPKGDIPKLMDAFAKASHVIQQHKKQGKRDIASFADGELIERIKSLPEQRRESIVAAITAGSMAGRPLY